MRALVRTPKTHLVAAHTVANFMQKEVKEGKRDAA
jgi:hypothetical protein